jgi:hypothetical protein
MSRTGNFLKKKPVWVGATLFVGAYALASQSAEQAGYSATNDVIEKVAPAVGGAAGWGWGLLSGAERAIFDRNDGSNINTSTNSSEGQSSGDIEVISGDSWWAILGRVGLNDTEIQACVAEHDLQDRPLTPGQTVQNPC